MSQRDEWHNNLQAIKCVRCADGWTKDGQPAWEETGAYMDQRVNWLLSYAIMAEGAAGVGLQRICAFT